MPTSITIEDVPDSVRDELAARASRKGLTLEEYLRGELDALADKPDMESLLARIAERKEICQTTFVERGHLGLPRPRPSVSLIVDASILAFGLDRIRHSGNPGPRTTMCPPLGFDCVFLRSAPQIRGGQTELSGDNFRVWCNPSSQVTNGSSTSTPSWRKSRTFRVTTVNPCTSAVAAIIASSKRVLGRPCMSLAHTLKAVVSIAKTL